ncbi:MAG: hypothetical protein WBL27_00625 [Salinimicrobium sp.]
MDRTQQVSICKTCTNQSFDMNKGVICGLTNDIGLFETECHDFVVDEQAKKDAEEELARRYPYDTRAKQLQARTAELKGQVDPLRTIKTGANWFYWIGALSLINSLVLLMESEYNFIAGLGITQVFDGVLMEIMGGYNILGLIPSIFFSFIFAGLGYYANKHYKIAFLIGLIFYGFDSLLFLIVGDLLSVGFHAFAFFMIFKGYKALKTLEVKNEPVPEEIN